MIFNNRMSNKGYTREKQWHERRQQNKPKTIRNIIDDRDVSVMGSGTRVRYYRTVGVSERNFDCARLQVMEET